MSKHTHILMSLSPFPCRVLTDPVMYRGITGVVNSRVQKPCLAQKSALQSGSSFYTAFSTVEATFETLWLLLSHKHCCFPVIRPQLNPNEPSISVDSFLLTPSWCYSACLLEAV